jgi:hypothetical protein
MTTLDDAMARQAVIQRRRTISWILFGLFVPVALLFWSEAIFGLGNLAAVGILQTLAETIIALLASYGAVHTFRSGMRLNRMLDDTTRLLDEDSDSGP